MIKAILFDCYGVVLDVYTNQPQADVIQFIASLKGQYKLGLVSNVPQRASIDRHFAPGEIDKLFELVVASGEIGYEKPQPEIYQQAAARLGVAPNECLFVDDIERFCQGAIEVGMQAFHFFDSTYGLVELKKIVGNS